MASRAKLQNYENLFMYFTESEWRALQRTSGHTLMSRKQIAEDRAYLLGCRNPSEYTLKVEMSPYTDADTDAMHMVRPLTEETHKKPNPMDFEEVRSVLHFVLVVFSIVFSSFSYAGAVAVVYYICGLTVAAWHHDQLDLYG